MEEFRDIPGFPGLKATSFGRIIGKKGKEIGSTAKTYVTITTNIGSVCKSYGRGNLILRAFVGEPPPDKSECDHIDRNKHNDRPENLRWADRAEQMQNRDVKADSISGIKGLRLMAGKRDSGDRLKCEIRHNYITYRQYFPIDQIEEATAWLINKREELMG
jgi:hypothetical protein